MTLNQSHETQEKTRGKNRDHCQKIKLPTEPDPGTDKILDFKIITIVQ